uniref:Cellular retinoic acid binding protein 2 n=1 Tax=Ficedula albicollis TaxID=59894 RepID=U3JKN3_FICAL
PPPPPPPPPPLRKIAVAAAAKPAVEIRQDGESFYIRTSTPVRTTEIRFRVGEEFEEQTVDGRPCKSLARWESDNKMVCEQRLLKGDGPKTGWAVRGWEIVLCLGSSAGGVRPHRNWGHLWDAAPAVFQRCSLGAAR